MLSDLELLTAYREGFSPADPHSGLRAVEAAVRADMQREVRTVEELDALPLKTALLCTGSLSGEGDEDGVYLIEPAYQRTHPRRFVCSGTTWFDPQDFLDCWESIAVLFTPSTPNQQGAEHVE